MRAFSLQLLRNLGTYDLGYVHLLARYGPPVLLSDNLLENGSYSSCGTALPRDMLRRISSIGMTRIFTASGSHCHILRSRDTSPQEPERNSLGKPGTPANPAKRTALNAIKPRGNTSRSVSTATSGGLHGSRSHLCNGPVEGRGVLKQPAIRDVGLARRLKGFGVYALTLGLRQARFVGFGV